MNQTKALEILKCGHNVYLTGPAGSGKTYLLKKYIEYLKKKKVRVAVTASTGIAATHLGGMTIHSWAGIGIKNQLQDKDLKDIVKRKHIKEKIKNSRVLIVDEVSMLHDFQLDMVDRVCRTIKKDPRPFGGMQIIMSGDFFQLPPINTANDETGFVTNSAVWQEMDLKICYLNEQYRHGDKTLIKILNEIRQNNVSSKSYQFLLDKIEKKEKFSVSPTKLYTHNCDVDKINQQQLETLSGHQEEYAMKKDGVKAVAEALAKSCLAAENLVLKEGAVVMFLRNNFERGFVNGTLGKIIGFDVSGYPVVKTTDGKEIIASPESWVVEEDRSDIARVTQVPLRLAWAITVHKSQGMSLDLAEIDLGKTFERGMGYVALSRVKSFEGMDLRGINDLAFEINSEVIEIDKNLKSFSEKAEKQIDSLTKKDKTILHKDFVEKKEAKDTLF